MFGELYQLTSDEPEDHVAYIAQRVDHLMRDVAAHALGVDPKRIAVLVALRLASQLSQLESHIEKAKKEELKLAELIDRELHSMFL